MPRKSSHTKALEKIANSPNEFGIENVRSFVLEQKLFDSRGRQIAEPDIVFFCIGKEGPKIFIIEYKGDGNGAYQDRAQEQVTMATAWYAKNTPYEPGQIHAKTIAGNELRYKKLFRELPITCLSFGPSFRIAWFVSFLSSHISNQKVSIIFHIGFL